MSKSGKIRVLVADDHAILRSGLRMLIDAQPDMIVVAEAQEGAEAIRNVIQTQPDVVILDITMPNVGGLNAIAGIVNSKDDVRVLLLTMHEEAAYVRTALTAGASGYVLKKSVDADLLSAIRAVYKGRTYVDSDLANSLVHDVFTGSRHDHVRGTHNNLLTEREVQVLKLVAEGYSSREIGERICVSAKTVETYRGRFAEKLGLKSRADIVRYALDLGLLTPDNFSVPKTRVRKSSGTIQSK
jgi:two-component system response regulator NreC